MVLRQFCITCHMAQKFVFFKLLLPVHFISLCMSSFFTFISSQCSNKTDNNESFPGPHDTTFRRSLVQSLGQPAMATEILCSREKVGSCDALELKAPPDVVLVVLRLNYEAYNARLHADRKFRPMANIVPTTVLFYSIRLMWRVMR